PEPATEPAEIEPAAAEPATTEPATTEPEPATEPAEIEPAAAEPAAAEPATTEPSQPSGELAVSTDSLDFGTLAPSGTAQRQVELTNVGEGDLTLGTPMLEDPGSVFAVGDLPATLAPGESVQLSITVTGDGLGHRTASLTLPSDDPGGSTTIKLTVLVTHWNDDGVTATATTAPGAAFYHVLRLAASGAALVSVDGAVDLAPTGRVIAVVGGDGNDRITVSGSGIGLAVMLDGGAGADTLAGPAVDTVWTVTGAGTGTVAGVRFAGFERLAGAPDNRDTFVLEEGGVLDDVTLDGGTGGFDVLDVRRGVVSAAYTATGPQSGRVTLDDASFSYVGLEPVSIGGTDALVITLADSDDVAVLRVDGTNLFLEVTSGTAESHTFAAPTSSLTIELGAGNDSLAVESLTSGFAATLDIEGVDVATGANPGLGGDQDTDTVTISGSISTNGGDFFINATHIIVADGVVVSTEDPADPDGAGNLQFWGRQFGTDLVENLAPAGYFAKSASVSIGEGAQIRGGNVTFMVYAEDRALAEIAGMNPLVNTFVGGPIHDAVGALTDLPLKFLIKKSTATFTVGDGAQIHADGTVLGYVNATADATGSANGMVGSIAFAWSEADATVDIGDDVIITAGDAISIYADASATANMSASTGQQLETDPTGGLAFSIAITYAKIGAPTTVGTGTALDA
ncbi:MAG: hypothetical protein L0H59_16580, partial [Tomitella sp.]|nr:hypothetical protein [Tomitella sp.]